MIPKAALQDVFPLQASKWLKLPLLLTEGEMEALLASLGQMILAPLSGVFAPGLEVLNPERFLALYASYLASLLKGKPAPDRRLTFAITKEADALRQVPVDGGVLMRIIQPVIQVQPYTLHYSLTAGEFHEMTHSSDNLFWGLLFSFPQLCQDPKTQEVHKVVDPAFPNAALFKSMQRWAREHTVPTPFQVGEKVINCPARIGKKALGIVAEFPQLKEKGIALCQQK